MSDIMQLEAVLPKAKGLFWAGQWHVPADARMMNSINPSDGEVLGGFICAGEML